MVPIERLQNTICWPFLRRLAPIAFVCLALWFMPRACGAGEKPAEQPQQSSSAPRLALVIGNSAYAGEAALVNPGNDADAVEGALKQLDFTVIKKKDVTKDEMEDTLVDFQRNLPKGGLGLFYFAGHGVQVEGVNYLVPIGARIREEFEVKRQCLEVGQVVDAMAGSESNLKVVVLDCCRNNPFKRGWRRALADHGLAAINNIPNGTLIAYSTAPGKSAEDGDGRNSPFAEHLSAALLSRPAGGLELREVFFEASRSVKKATGQVPWLNMEASLEKYYLHPAVDSSNQTPVELAHLEPARSQMQPNQKKQADVKLPSDISTKTNKKQDTDLIAKSNPGRSIDLPLLRQAESYLRQGDHENAITAYSAIIDDSALDIDVRREARKNRGSAYLARHTKADLEKALIDKKAANEPGILLSILVPEAELNIGPKTNGKVKSGQTVLVTETNGNWLWVQSVGGSDKIQGYLPKEAVLPPPVVVPKPVPVPAPVVQAPPAGQQYKDNGYGGNNYKGNNFSQSKSAQQMNNGGDDYTREYTRKHGRPPSAMETPRWESPQEIRELRAQGLLR